MVSGSGVTVTLQAEDAGGNKLNTGGLTVAFALGSGSGGQGTFSAVTDNHNGTYTATFTGTLDGVNFVNATIGGQAVTSTRPAISVIPGPVSLVKSFISLSSATVASGSGVLVTLQAEDAAGNKLLAGGLAVVVALGSASGGHGTFGSVTDNQNGTYTAVFAGTTVGSNTITATIGGKAVTSTAPSIAVTQGPVSQIKSLVSLSSASVAAGNGITVTLQTEDAAGNKLTTGGLTVAFSLGSTLGGHGTFSAVVDNHNGTYTSTFTGTTAGSNTIKASITGQTVTSPAPAITVTIGPVNLAKSFVSLSSASVASGSGVTVTLQAEDAAGNKLAAGGLTVAFALGSGTGHGTFSAVTDNHNGTYTAVFTATTAGSNTISATIGGQAVTSTAPAVAIAIGPVSLAKSFASLSSASVASGSSVTITLQAEDAAGNKLITGGLTVAFALGTATGGKGTFSAVTDNHDGTYSATFAGTTAGANTVKATIGGLAATSAAPAITVTPGPVSLTKSFVTPASSNVVSGAVDTVTLQTEDAAGNKLTTGGLTVTFALGSADGGQGTFSAVTDNHNGTYTATFTGTTAGANTVVATIGGQVVGSAGSSVTPLPSRQPSR